MKLLKEHLNRASWLPKLFTAPSFYHSTDSFFGKQNRYSLNTTIVQNFPLGISLNAGVLQNLYLPTPSSSSYSYSPIFNSALSIPIPFLAPSIALDSLLAAEESKKPFEDLALLNLEWARIETEHDGIQNLGEYLITELTIKNLANREQFLKQQSDDDERLLEAGRLSILDPSVRDKERFQNTADFAASSGNLIEYQKRIRISGWADAIDGISIEGLLNFRESRLDDDLYSTCRSEKIWLVTTAKEWNDECKTDLLSLPSTTIAFNTNPMSDNAGDDDPWKTITGYWSGKVSWAWNVTASINVSIDPSSASFRASALHAEKRKLFLLKKEEVRIAAKEARFHRDSILSSLMAKRATS